MAGALFDQGSTTAEIAHNLASVLICSFGLMPSVIVAYGDILHPRRRLQGLQYIQSCTHALRNLVEEQKLMVKPLLCVLEIPK